jgi:hypothetical protein
MHKRIVFVVGLLTATAIAAAELVPLSISIGAWQVTMTSTINGMPPKTSTYTSCVQPTDLTKYPFTDPKANCTWNVVSSTGSTMQANGTCKPENMGTMQFDMQLTAKDPQHVKGTGHLTGNGPNGPISGDYSGEGKWIVAQCPGTRPTPR